MNPTKFIKRIFDFMLIFMLLIILFSVFIFPVSADGGAVPAETGDNGFFGIVIALIVFIAAAFITIKLTKSKNRKNKL